MSHPQPGLPGVIPVVAWQTLRRSDELRSCWRTVADVHAAAAQADRADGLRHLQASSYNVRHEARATPLLSDTLLG